MNRKEFLLNIGKGAALISLSGCLEYCGKDSNPSVPGAPQNVDFTLDLGSSGNSDINTPGGYIYNQGIIIARTGANSFAAVSQACTHQGTTLIFQLSQNRFHCNNHGSNFNTNGTVINGPASSPLTVYKTQLNGNNLRVTSS